MIPSEPSKQPVLNNGKLIAVWGVLVVAVVAVLVVPKMRESASLRTEILSLDADIKQLSATNEVIERLAAVRDELVNFGEGRVAIIPERSDVAGLMTELSEIFTEAGLEGREMTSQPEQQIDDVIMMPMVVRATGYFPQIYEVVSDLEHLSRLVRIGRLRIEKVENARRGGVSRNSKVQADILIEAFYENPAFAGVNSEGER